MNNTAKKLNRSKVLKAMYVYLNRLESFLESPGWRISLWR
jgi:hypothetical protein